jgi:outer membrane protein assembly factor BamB
MHTPSAIVRFAPILCASLALACVEDVEPANPGTGPEVLSVDAASVSPSAARVTIELSEPASVAAACVRRDRPTEVHLLEADGASSVELPFVGLVAATDYDCNVAPIGGSAPAATASFRTPDLPFEAASADVEGDPAAATGAYTIANVRPECHGIERNYITVLDAEGNNRWHHELPPGLRLDVAVRPDGPNRVLWGGGKSPAGAPTVTDVAEGDLWTLAFPGSEEAHFHHDAKRIADGRVLSLEESDHPGWDAFQLRLSDEAGETTWFYDAADAVEDGWLREGGPDLTDPHHANWADVVDAGDGPVAYVSLCFAFQIVAIDATNGDPVWRFGHGGDFTLEDAAGQPLSTDEFPKCQHGVDTDGSTLLIYDNGFDRGFTRVVEFELDTERMVATKTWDWRDDGFWEEYHGGAEWLTPDHQRVLVVEAHNACGDDADRATQIVEVDRATDEAVHRLTLRDVGHWVYNAHRVDGCELFANAEACPAIAERVEELRPILGL